MTCLSSQPKPSRCNTRLACDKEGLSSSYKEKRQVFKVKPRIKVMRTPGWFKCFHPNYPLATCGNSPKEAYAQFVKLNFGYQK